MRGPGVEIRVGPRILYGDQNQDPRIWCVSKALLSYHSGLFKVALSGPQAQSTLVIDDDHDTFDLFYEYMLRGLYTWRDNLRVHDGIRGSAKAWALGANLQVPKFQNLAMTNLHNIYKPANRPRPMSGIGPVSMEWICESFVPGEKLYDFFRDVLVTYWSDHSVVCHGPQFKAEWDALFKTYPSLSQDLINRLSEPGNQIKGLHEYLIPEESEDVGEE